jgi:hypothetical protein
LLHAPAKALALFFAQTGPAGAKVTVHSPLPAILHVFTHACAPTRATRKHRHADGDEKQGPEQVHKRRVDETKVLEHAEHANADEGERNNAHGSLQNKAGARVR